MLTQKLKAIDLFAGIGGMRLGFTKAGFEIVYSNDFDRHACQTYRANFGGIDERNIADVEVDQIPDFDVLLGGFPCQPFSMIGKRKGMKDERAKSFFHIIRILSVKQPRAFVLENVKHLRLYDKGRVYQRIKSNLEWCGYKVYEKVLDSKDFGVPQHRERLYMVGLKEHDLKFDFPSPHRRIKNLSDILETQVDEKHYLSERYYAGLLNHKLRHQKGGNGFGCAILDPDGISNTIVAGNMGRERNLIRDKKNKKNRWGIRRLTVHECAELQGFPKSFKFPVSMTQSYKQLGNAVTVNVARTIAKSLKKILDFNTSSGNKEILDKSSSAFGELSASQLEKTAAT
jgi:DNA (cytosine-5)-methyltransferase 1